MGVLFVGKGGDNRSPKADFENRRKGREGRKRKGILFLFLAYRTALCASISRSKDRKEGRPQAGLPVCLPFYYSIIETATWTKLLSGSLGLLFGLGCHFRRVGQVGRFGLGRLGHKP